MSQAEDDFHKNKRRCKTILTAALVLVFISFAVAVWSQTGIALVWLTEETLTHTAVILFMGAFALLALFAPRCPHCGRKVPQWGMEGESKVGPEAEACPSCLRSLPR